MIDREIEMCYCIKLDRKGKIRGGKQTFSLSFRDLITERKFLSVIRSFCVGVL